MEVIISSYFFPILKRHHSKKLGKFLGQWNEETEARKLNKAKQFEQFTSQLVNGKNLSLLTREYITSLAINPAGFQGREEF